MLAATVALLLSTQAPAPAPAPALSVKDRLAVAADDLDSSTVCMPGVSFDKTPCTSDEECLGNGMPVDVFCGDEGLCTCEGLIADGAPSCYSGNAHGRFACACVALDEGNAGDNCDHPEACASGICNDGSCANACDSNDDCGGLTTTCEADGTCS